jgi:hypothetical protein
MPAPVTRIGRGGPTLVVHLAHPIEKRHQVGDLDIGHVLFGHEPPVALLVVELRRILQVGLKIRGATMLRDLGQVRRVVGAFAKQRVTVDAVVLVPDILAMGDGGRDVLCIREFGELPVAVDGQPQENHYSHDRRTDREESSLSLIHGLIGSVRR